jgi:hypothetical protein
LETTRDARNLTGFPQDRIEAIDSIRTSAAGGQASTAPMVSYGMGAVRTISGSLHRFGSSLRIASNRSIDAYCLRDNRSWIDASNRRAMSPDRRCINCRLSFALGEDGCWNASPRDAM